METKTYKPRKLKINEEVYIIDDFDDILAMGKIQYIEGNSDNSPEYNLNGNEPDNYEVYAKITKVFAHHDELCGDTFTCQVNDCKPFPHRFIYQIIPNKKFHGFDVCFEHKKIGDYPYYCPYTNENVYEFETTETTPVNVNDDNNNIININDTVQYGIKQDVIGGIDFYPAVANKQDGTYFFKSEYLFNEEHSQICYIQQDTFEENFKKTTISSNALQPLLITPNNYEQLYLKNNIWTYDKLYQLVKNTTQIKFTKIDYERITKHLFEELNGENPIDRLSTIRFDDELKYTRS